MSAANSDAIFNEPTQPEPVGRYYEGRKVFGGRFTLQRRVGREEVWLATLFFLLLTAGGQLAAWDSNDLVPVEPPVKRLFAGGFEVVAEPSPQSPVLKTLPPGTEATVAARFQIDGTVYFMSDWSYERWRTAGARPNWIREIGIAAARGGTGMSSAPVIEGAESVAALSEEVIKLRDEGNLPAALEAAHGMLTRLERTLPLDHPDLAEALAHLATVHDLREEHDKALPLWQRAFELLNKAGQPLPVVDSTLRLEVDPAGHLSKISELFFTPDGARLISVGEDRTIRFWDPETGRHLKSLRRAVTGDTVGAPLASALSPDGRWLALLTGLGHPRDAVALLQMVDLSRGEMVSSVRIPMSPRRKADGDTPPCKLQFFPNGNHLLNTLQHVNNQGSFTDIALSWRIENGDNPSIAHLQQSLPGPVEIAPDEVSLVAAGSFWKKLPMNGMFSKRQKIEILEGRGDYRFKKDGLLVAPIWSVSNETDTLMTIDPVSGRAGLAIAMNLGTIKGETFKLSFDNSLVALQDAGSFYGGLHVYPLRISAPPSLLFTDKAESSLAIEGFSAVSWHPLRNEMAVAGNHNGSDSIYFWKPQGRDDSMDDSASVKNIAGPSLPADQTLFAETSSILRLGKRATFAGHWTQTHEFDFTHWVLQRTPDIPSKALSDLRDHDVSPDQKYRLENEGAVTRLLDHSTGNLLASLFVAADEEWVCWTPDGYFAASANGGQYLIWHQNRGLDQFAVSLSGEQLFAPFYRPEVVRRSILERRPAGEIAREMGIPAFKVEEAIQNRPQVRFMEPAVSGAATVERQTLWVTADLRVAELRLFHDGKALAADGPPRPKADGEGMEVPFTASLLPGVNRFRAVAIQENGVESLPVELELTFDGVRSTATLHILAVGINDYRNPRYSLNYCRSDMEALVKTLSQRAESLFASVNARLLVDAKATQEGIETALKEVARVAGPQDAFVFAFAGHGVMSEGDPLRGGEFHLIPHEVIQMHADDEELATKAMPASHIAKWSAQIAAQKQMLILDACQSGGMLEAFAVRGAAEEKAIAKLARSTGMVVLASSRTEQFATELPKLGHGLFTYALLEALSGKADVDGDGNVTVREIDLYLNERVPKLSEEHLNGAQYPTSFARGQDFPLVLSDKAP